MIINDTVTEILAFVGVASIFVIFFYGGTALLASLYIDLLIWKDKRAKKREESRTNKGYLYIKAYNEYAESIIGTDIELSFKQKVQILFSKGISVCIGKAIKKE